MARPAAARATALVIMVFRDSGHDRAGWPDASPAAGECSAGRGPPAVASLRARSGCGSWLVTTTPQARKFGMTEQSRQPSGVHENSAVFALDASAGDARDQAGQSACRIGGVKEDALGAGGQPHRLPRGR